MVIALADSFFFSVDLDAARTQVMLFLAVSFAPFLFIAPLIGPMIDRIKGGRRFVIQLVAVLRLVLSVLMARYVDSFALFPLVFASLVLQKTYIVSKSAIVPSTVRSQDELVEANAKLGLIAGLIESGRTVRPFKVGPDFIDTGFHAALSRRPCYNLDGWMMQGDRLVSTFGGRCGAAATSAWSKG